MAAICVVLLSVNDDIPYVSVQAKLGSGRSAQHLDDAAAYMELPCRDRIAGRHILTHGSCQHPCTLSFFRNSHELQTLRKVISKTRMKLANLAFPIAHGS